MDKNFIVWTAATLERNVNIEAFKNKLHTGILALILFIDFGCHFQVNKPALNIGNYLSFLVPTNKICLES